MEGSLDCWKPLPKPQRLQTSEAATTACYSWDEHDFLRFRDLKGRLEDTMAVVHPVIDAPGHGAGGSDRSGPGGPPLPCKDADYTR
jgi:hypothetical protein